MSGDQKKLACMYHEQNVYHGYKLCLSKTSIEHTCLYMLYASAVPLTFATKQKIFAIFNWKKGNTKKILSFEKKKI